MVWSQTVFIVFPITVCVLTAGLLVQWRKAKFFRTRIDGLESELSNAHVLRRIFELSNYEMKPEILLKGVLETLVEHFEATDGTIFLTDGNRLVCKATTIMKPYEDINSIPRYAEFGASIEDMEPVILVGNGFFNYATAYERRIRYAFYVPFIEKGQVIGAILLESTEVNAMKPERESQFYQLVADAIRKTMGKCLQMERVYMKANFDQLTGALKRESLMAQVNELVLFAKSLTVVMMDLDHFKKVNDTYGHDVGDTVLKEVFNLLHNSLRRGDLVARWGGDEFVLILLDAQETMSSVVVDRLRAKIEEQVIKHGDIEISFVTASMGLAIWKPCMNFDAVLKEADEKAYLSKKEGRNRLTTV